MNNAETLPDGDDRVVQAPEAPPWWLAGRWTLLLSAVGVVLNLGLFPWALATFRELLPALQLDPAAVRAGEGWRLLTGNLVHWTPRHLYLDVAAFLVLGLLYERYLPRSYPWLLLWTALAVGLAGMWFLPERTLCRGLSGVNAGQFAAAVCIEARLAWRDPGRWLWAAPATVLFLTWLIYGGVTGRFFGSALLGETGKVAAWAHLTGAAAAAVFVVPLLIRQRPETIPTQGASAASEVRS